MLQSFVCLVVADSFSAEVSHPTAQPSPAPQTMAHPGAVVGVLVGSVLLVALALAMMYREQTDREVGNWRTPEIT